MSRSKYFVFSLAATLATSVGCAKEPAAKKGQDTPPPTAPVTLGDKQPTGKTMSAEVLLRSRAALSHYETLRAALAADDLKPVAGAAAQLAEVAKVASEKASGSAKASLEGIAKTSLELKNKSEIDAARLTFGEVSKHLVGLVAAEPELQRDRYVFECPMAKGYKKWVQTKTALENPYMGKKMLECGSKTDWSI